MKYVAVYRDQEGATFSCPVTRAGNEYKLLTQHGPREISYYVYGSDCAGGYATFRDFRMDDVPRGLRGCDYGELCKQMYKVLPWPTPPAEPPIPQTQPEDFRLHVEAGGDSFIRLQEAGVRATAEYETNRERARREMLAELNQPDAQKARQAQAYAAEILHARRPRGRGAAFIIKTNGE